MHVTVLADDIGFDRLGRMTADSDVALTDFGLGLPPAAYANGTVADPARAIRGGSRTPLRDDCVVMAIIDDGIGFANERFRSGPTSTRVECFWDMRVPPKDAGSVDAVVGRVLRRDDIDELLTRFQGEEEELIYRDCGIIDPSDDRRQQTRFRNSHGTHVLDVAAGYDYRNAEEREVAVRRPIIAVQLPSELIAERSDAFTAQWLKLALSMIRHRAMELAERTETGVYLPVIVNFSFGTFAGPHDGDSAIERTIQAFIEDYRALPGNPKCEVVIPAGNGFQSQSVAKLLMGAKDETHELPWRVQPDDKTASFVQIWLPDSDDGEQQVAVALRPPVGGPAQDDWTVLGQALEWQAEGHVMARLYHQKVPRKNGRTRERVVIAIHATASDDEHRPCCPAGVWTVRVRNLRLKANAVVDVRIQRDDSLMGQRPTGRQSYFDHPAYDHYEDDNGRVRNHSCRERGPVTRRSTFNSYATGLLPIVVGGYRRSDGTPALYSGSGPTTSGRPGPTVSAVCEESPAHPGVLASGTYSGSTLRQNGTSVAAPAVARELARYIEAGGCRSWFLDQVTCADGAGLPSPQTSYGKVQPARQGAGRLQMPDQPLHRRRLET